MELNDISGDIVDAAVAIHRRFGPGLLESAFSPVHAKQLKTYLVLADRRLGLLLNFGMESMKDGIKRILNGDVPDLKKSPCLRTSV